MYQNARLAIFVDYMLWWFTDELRHYEVINWNVCIDSHAEGKFPSHLYPEVTLFLICLKAMSCEVHEVSIFCSTSCDESTLLWLWKDVLLTSIMSPGLPNQQAMAIYNTLPHSNSSNCHVILLSHQWPTYFSHMIQAQEKWNLYTHENSRPCGGFCKEQSPLPLVTSLIIRCHVHSLEKVLSQFLVPRYGLW